MEELEEKLNCNWRVTGHWGWTVWGKNSRGMQLWELSLHELYQILPVNMREKSLHTIPRGRVSTEKCQSTKFFLTMPALRRSPSQSLPFWVLSAPNLLAGREIHNGSPTNHSVHRRGLGDGSWEALVKFIVKRYNFTKRLRPNRRTTEPFFSPCTSPLLKAYLPQFILSSIPCLPFNKKLQGILKGQNKEHNLKRKSKYQNQTQIWLGC